MGDWNGEEREPLPPKIRFWVLVLFSIFAVGLLLYGIFFGGE